MLNSSCLSIDVLGFPEIASMPNFSAISSSAMANSGGHGVDMLLISAVEAVSIPRAKRTPNAQSERPSGKSVVVSNTFIPSARR